MSIQRIKSGVIADGQVTNDKMTLAANASAIKTALNASGDAGIFTARAWVNFNGTGTVAIRASGNVTSITDNGAGDYTVNFTTAMPDANYSSLASGNNAASLQYPFQAINNSASACRVTSYNGSTFADMANIHVAIFR